MESILDSTNLDNPYSDVHAKVVNSYFTKKLSRIVLKQGNDIIHLDTKQIDSLIQFLIEAKDGE
ncbi:hypothetical protein KP1_87 [Klebsiella phage KP1]|uniref:Uncharacterized protein n=1 Tax=Klebsiella phage KP1 TaxID=2070202 RepID=A0A2K9V5K3_9CAUD|nr:hypothetical protein KP1_87 [Klebsiella phage KP1]BEH88772.1 hypothetical protein [Klebsiella phage phiKp_22]